MNRERLVLYLNDDGTWNAERLMPRNNLPHREQPITCKNAIDALKGHDGFDAHAICWGDSTATIDMREYKHIENAYDAYIFVLDGETAAFKNQDELKLWILFGCPFNNVELSLAKIYAVKRGENEEGEVDVTSHFFGNGDETKFHFEELFPMTHVLYHSVDIDDMGDVVGEYKCPSDVIAKMKLLGISIADNTATVGIFVNDDDDEYAKYWDIADEERERRLQYE